MSVFNARSELLPWGSAQLSPLTIKKAPQGLAPSQISPTPQVQCDEPVLKEKYLCNAADARILMSTYRVDFYLVPIKK